MKYNLNFIQILNWLYILRQNMDKIDFNTDTNITIEKLKNQQHNLNKVIDVLNKKIKLVGVQKKFLEEYKKMKRD